jgi:single-strand DNA-binding protein
VFDTNITIVGNVLTAPEWRRTPNTNSLVANFKVASTARRLDRESGRWVDGNSLRVRVNCWRRLAEGVAASVMVGDPIIVAGRLYTRDWTDADGNARTMYEMEAVAVGHDLSRGRGRFTRNRPTLATSAVDDAQADIQVRGEATEAVPADEAPARPGEGLYDDDPDFGEIPASAPAGFDPIAAVRGGGFDPPTPAASNDELAPFDEPESVADVSPFADLAGSALSADDPDGEFDADKAAPREDVSPDSRRTRHGRVPAPA